MRPRSPATASQPVPALPSARSKSSPSPRAPAARPTAGCSSPDWDRSFRAEMAKVFPEYPVTALGMDHPIFHTVYDVTTLQGLHGPPRPLEGVTLAGRIGVIYSIDGLNDTAHTQGCCC